MRNIVIVIFVLLSNTLFGQLHDNNWLLGIYGGLDPNDEYGISQLSFHDGSLHIEENKILYGGFYINNTTFSDSIGNILATFNGYWINDKSWEKMLNGDSIWYEEEPNLFGFSDPDVPQSGLFLSWPNHPDSLFLFYSSQGNAGSQMFVELACLHLQYALIRLSGNNGLGEVVKRREIVLKDTIQYGRLLVVKHANGRDWWLPINERNTNRYYRYLIDPSGIHLMGQQTIGVPVIDGLSQAAFSPNGHFLAVYNSISSSVGVYLDIYEFDRCEGLLFNHRQMHYTSGNFGGCAISPNSQYLYVSFNTQIFQYDLFADDLENSRVLIGEYVPPPLGTPPETFFHMQLAPDGKIYVCSFNYMKSLHVIHSPDNPGVDCQFERIGIKLPVYSYESVTYNPYFRLGPLDGSSCDTLGLDNHPVAWWRSQQDTLNPLIVNFHDLSYYGPASWHWDFGDGQTSDERHPTHVFDSTGAYKVCLMVVNNNSSDTLCRTLYLGVLAQNNPDLQAQVQVFPNPFSNKLAITLNSWLDTPEVYLYNQLGNLICHKKVSIGVTEVETSSLPKGIYFWSVFSRNELVKNGKIIKVD